VSGCADKSAPTGGVAQPFCTKAGKQRDVLFASFFNNSTTGTNIQLIDSTRYFSYSKNVKKNISSLGEASTQTHATARKCRETPTG
jgi:hypothetical protein